MRKLLFWFFIILFGVYKGTSYLFSPEFQTYADKKKTPWTCYANLAIGHYYIVTSEYEHAYDAFKAVPDRCPDSSMQQSAEYEMAGCLANIGRNSDAVNAYNEFAQKYPNNSHADMARKAANIIKSGL